MRWIYLILGMVILSLNLKAANHLACISLFDDELTPAEHGLLARQIPDALLVANYFGISPSAVPKILFDVAQYKKTGLKTAEIEGLIVLLNTSHTQKFLSDSIVLKNMLLKIVQSNPPGAPILNLNKVITHDDIQSILYEFAKHRRLTIPSLARLMKSLQSGRVHLDAKEITLLSLLMDRFYADSKFSLFTNGEDALMVNFTHWRVRPGKSLDIPMSMTTDGQPLRKSGFKLMFYVERGGFDKQRNDMWYDYFSVKIQTEWGSELIFATNIPIHLNHKIGVTNQSVKIIEKNGKFYFAVSFKIHTGYKFEQHYYETEIPLDFLQ